MYQKVQLAIGWIDVYNRNSTNGQNITLIETIRCDAGCWVRIRAVRLLQQNILCLFHLQLHGRLIFRVLREEA